MPQREANGMIEAAGCTSRDEALCESYRRLVSQTYPLFLEKLGLNRTAVRAEGATITDSAGRQYIDCVAGYGLFNLGHNHPGIAAAVRDHLDGGQLFARPFITEPQVRLAEQLEAVLPGDLACSFICNSGSEAIDCALKLVRLHKGGRPIIAAENSFHGCTFGALAASGIPRFKRPFEPLVPGFVHVPYRDVEALEQQAAAGLAAVLLEPIQHEAGISLPPEGYLQAVRRICDRYGAILIFDEVKTGCGKTGRLLACEHSGVVPDVLVLGKSLGGGLMPIGAVIAKRSLWKRFSLSFPMSASSFAGNALACRAGLATLQHLRRDGLLEACAEKGRLLLKAFREQVRQYPGLLRSADGLGLLIGITARGSRAALELAREMIRQGVLTVPAFANPAVLMVEPPLIIDSMQVKEVALAFARTCAKVSETSRVEQ